MKNKDFNLIEFLKQKNIFVSNEDIKNKNFKIVQAAHGSSIYRDDKTLKNSVTNVTNRSRTKNFGGCDASVIIFVDFKTKQIITNMRGK